MPSGHRNLVKFSMDTKVKDRKGNVNVWSKKLYTQHEVDDLLKKKEESISSQSSDIKEEKQAAETQKRRNNRKVANLIKISNRILVSITSHAFPIDFLPDVLNIEEERITIINRHLLSSEVHSVDIKDISNVFINTTIWYSELTIISKTFEDNEISISKLRTKEAVFARRIIEGLRTFDSKQVDTSSYTKEELISKLEQLSTTEIVT